MRVCRCACCPTPPVFCSCLLTCVDADDMKYLFSVLRIEQVQSQGKWTTNSHGVWQFDLNIGIKTCMTSHRKEPHFTATPAAFPNVHASALFPYESCFYNSQLFLHHIPCNNLGEIQCTFHHRAAVIGQPRQDGSRRRQLIAVGPALNLCIHFAEFTETHIVPPKTLSLAWR